MIANPIVLKSVCDSTPFNLFYIFYSSYTHDYQSGKV